MQRNSTRPESIVPHQRGRSQLLRRVSRRPGRRWWGTGPTWCSGHMTASREDRGHASGHLTGRDIAGAVVRRRHVRGAARPARRPSCASREARAGAITLGWRRSGYAESARIGPGHPWVWLTRAGLAACGLPYAAASPALSRLAHLRAVASVRLALEAAPGYAAAGAFWRGERRLRARTGGRVGLTRAHPRRRGALAGRGAGRLRRRVLGDRGRTHPQDRRREPPPSCSEILTRTGDYGCPAAEVRVPGVAAAARPGRVPVLARGAGPRSPGPGPRWAARPAGSRSAALPPARHAALPGLAGRGPAPGRAQAARCHPGSGP